jgi:hypothetical protein
MVVGEPPEGVRVTEVTRPVTSSKLLELLKV